jgi:hypothetical protein
MHVLADAALLVDDAEAQAWEAGVEIVERRRNGFASRLNFRSLRIGAQLARDRHADHAAIALSE